MLFTSVPVSAKEQVYKSEYPKTLYAQIHAKPERYWIGRARKGDKIKISFSKKGIVKANKLVSPLSNGNELYEFYFTPLKPGETTLTLKITSKDGKITNKYIDKFIVYKYDNPISSITITNSKTGKTTISGSKLKKDNVVKLSYNKFCKGHNKITVKAKKGGNISFHLVDKNGDWVRDLPYLNPEDFTLNSKYKTKNYHIEVNAFKSTSTKVYSVNSEIYFK